MIVQYRSRTIRTDPWDSVKRGSIGVFSFSIGFFVFVPKSFGFSVFVLTVVCLFSAFNYLLVCVLLFCAFVFMFLKI